LEEFLMDERVIDVPKWFRSFLVKGIILKTRPKKSAKAYQKIWWDEGSPLIVLSERLHKKVAQKTSVPISLAYAIWSTVYSFRLGRTTSKRGR
jgi:ferrochelatase